MSLCYSLQSDRQLASLEQLHSLFHMTAEMA